MRYFGREPSVLLDVVVTQRAAILQLLSREDQALLVGWDASEREAKAKAKAKGMTYGCVAQIADLSV